MAVRKVSVQPPVETPACEKTMSFPRLEEIRKTSSVHSRNASQFKSVAAGSLADRIPNRARSATRSPQQDGPRRELHAEAKRLWQDGSASFVRRVQTVAAEGSEMATSLAEIRHVAEALRTAQPQQLPRSALVSWAAALDTHASRIAASAPASNPRVVSPGQSPATSPREGSPNGAWSVGGLDSANTHCSAASYLLLEALAASCGAERATLWKWFPRIEYLQGVVSVGHTSSVGSVPRCPPGKGWAGQVFATGIGVNSGGGEADACFDGGRARSVLCLPLHDVVDRNRRVGAVQLLNRDRGASCFSVEDEAAVAAALPLLSYVLQWYPTDPARWRFDPTPLHRLRRWQPAAGPPGPPTKGGGGGEPRSHQLVYRTHQSGKWLQRSANRDPVPLHSPAVLVEVDAYVERLEDSWRRSVMLVCEYRDSSDASAKSYKELRDAVSHHKRELKRMEEEAHTRDGLCAEFRRNYENLASEIKSVLCDAADASKMPQLRKLTESSPGGRGAAWAALRAAEREAGPGPGSAHSA
eukprot:TRINITY_DN14002_c0_g1_i3.p1 TRINITY_DN14002_c0_g1~~TRINITY_DN14002_c0_g1_i3.p1  ORF type:complete len:543 (+),score=150.08 TRINITY_DN14002_c0_g1_i3:51-1631(+)